MDMITGFGGSVLGTLIPFLFVLTIVVFFHELGHFLVARWCGVAVRTFSVGFGPEIVGFNDRHGTRWRIAAIPLGGYVKFIDDMSAASTPNRDAAIAHHEGSFQGKSVARRAAIVAAGPIANFILAVVIFAGLFMAAGKPVSAPTVDGVQENSAAAVAGFQVGDLIKSIDGAPVESFTDLQRVVSGSAGTPLTIVVERAGQPVTLTATPERRETTDRFGNVHRVGMLGLQHTARNVTVVTYGPVGAVGEAVKETSFIVTRTLDYLWGVIIGRESPDQLGGPIRVAQVSGQVATLGIAPLINLAAILSVSIGLLNLFPIPLLDGGHLVFYAIEAIRGRPLSERAQDYGFRVGFAIVLALMVFATWNDLMQLAAG
ncbi:RIP metalloprotease RseP [Chthonobacter rhizosphaerae]|uniref:RIP metalloprotease RseP n=1 Tax=Chthonobacter rhizosphaerae TaxID=2735553 RepID=UPI0015EF7B97|nr:RIP metalloprotease RseP [Chthonobacter rhizosphaerae]